jgi:hypothetical protein
MAIIGIPQSVAVNPIGEGHHSDDMELVDNGLNINQFALSCWFFDQEIVHQQIVVVEALADSVAPFEENKPRSSRSLLDDEMETVQISVDHSKTENILCVPVEKCFVF